MLNPNSLPYAFLWRSFLIFLLFYSSALLAANSDLQSSDVIKQNISAEQNLRNERNELIRQKEIQEIDNIGKLKIIDKNFDGRNFDNDDGFCKLVKDFIFVGNEVFSNRFLVNKFLKKYSRKSRNDCLNKSNFNELRKEIENFYLEKGFILSRVYFDLKRLDLGVLVIVIEEGKLENLEIKDDSKLNNKLPFRRNSQKFFAFPIAKNDIVNLRDVEQGLDQINRLSSQNAKMALEPSDVEGYSNINIENKVSDLSSLNFGLDNSGNKRTGRQRHKVGLNQDNLLGIGDNIYLNYTQSSDVRSNIRYSKSFYSSISIPFGYWTIGGSYAASNYLLTTAGRATTTKSTGNSENKTYYIDRVLSRGQRHKISLKVELEKNDTDSYLEDVYIPVNSRRSANGNLYLTNIFYLKNGSIYLQPKYSKGLRGLGAKSDAKNLAPDQPRLQFDIYGLYAQINSNFNLPKVSLPLNYKLSFDSSFSEDSLYGNNQFSIGGRYTVRGFQESIISGDSGYFVKNDLKTSLVNFLPAKFLSPLLSKTTIGLFYDYGYVRNKVLNEAGDEGYMSGAGVGLNYVGKNFSCDLSYARGLHSPNFLRTVDQIKKEQNLIYLSLNFNFGLL